ncbi:hypothetical protein MVES_002970 [Malassezia vespertilionis]|uniref:Uncharacterized protein n=1 Tax=Malassezia vespertilionis TaxID=2020962 RepID=A0A2N1J9U0_9BASI|nr:hypothetical protein MVES_002970 [Malassezia vespertilionis]
MIRRPPTAISLSKQDVEELREAPDVKHEGAEHEGPPNESATRAPMATTRPASDAFASPPER